MVDFWFFIELEVTNGFYVIIIIYLTLAPRLGNVVENVKKRIYND